jgi:hypothetical protein
MRLAIKTLGDEVMLRTGVIAMLEIASVEPDPDRRKRMLTFVVAGLFRRGRDSWGHQ